MTLVSCISLECREEKAKPFEVSGPNPTCPKCGYGNTLRVVSTIHLMVRDVKGTIKGYNGNYRIACGLPFKDMKNGSGERSAANCPKCLAAVPEEKNLEDNAELPTDSVTPTPPDIE
jgi:hypothetical protein